MGKSKRADREFSKEKRFSHEIAKLKRENGRLRKILARLDLDRFGQLRETIERNCPEESQETGRNLLERLKEEWKCKWEGCDGHLEIFTYNKIDQTWYYRLCSNAPKCKNRTMAQKYDADKVKGIIRPTD